MGLIRTIADIYGASQERKLDREKLKEAIAGREAADIREQAKIDQAESAQNELAERMAGEQGIAQAKLQPELDLLAEQAGQARRSPSVGGGPEERTLASATSQINTLRAIDPAKRTPYETASLRSLEEFAATKMPGLVLPDPGVIAQPKPGWFAHTAQRVGEGIGASLRGPQGLQSYGDRAVAVGRAMAGVAPVAAAQPIPSATAGVGAYKEGDISKSGKFIVRSGQWVKR